MSRVLPLKTAQPSSTIEAKTEPVYTHDDANNWEISALLERQKSEHRAWTFFKWAVAVIFLQAVAMAFNFVLIKRPDPYVIKHNSQTGAMELLSVASGEIDFGELTAMHFLKKFIIARESYDFNTLQKDFNDVLLLSSPRVAKDYNELFSGDKALQDVYKDNVKVIIEVLSVVPTVDNTATIRYKKTTKKLKNEGESVTNNWVATVAYTYETTQKRKQADLIDNPPGFTVTSLRIDPEMVEGAGK